MNAEHSQHEHHNPHDDAHPAHPAVQQPASGAGVLVLGMKYWPRGEDSQFTRADLVFEGVDHSDISYEVRVFLNNPAADEKTERTAQNGYAGRFVIFGHGKCFGDLGHCDIPTGPRRAFDRRPVHPLTPQTKLVTVTEALQRVLAASEKGLESITLVPVSQDPIRKRHRLTPDLFHFAGMSLRTYR